VVADCAWVGANVDTALKRATRLADGWICLQRSANEARPAFEKPERYLAEAGRLRKDFGVEVRREKTTSKSRYRKGERSSSILVNRIIHVGKVLILIRH
jgi:alkanesulfonate monooxygenase SsuD/methylene tetrahydromethanopterin reductase-like flavin-dependent oxidoreductase (luciferase family)